MFFYEYSLVLVLNRMSKKLKSVMKKLSGGKSGEGTTDTLFQGCRTPQVTTHSKNLWFNCYRYVVMRLTLNYRSSGMALCQVTSRSS
jgi:hypothetical protein